MYHLPTYMLIYCVCLRLHHYLHSQINDCHDNVKCLSLKSSLILESQPVYQRPPWPVSLHFPKTKDRNYFENKPWISFYKKTKKDWSRKRNKKTRIHSQETGGKDKRQKDGKETKFSTFFAKKLRPSCCLWFSGLKLLPKPNLQLMKWSVWIWLRRVPGSNAIKQRNSLL